MALKIEVFDDATGESDEITVQELIAVINNASSASNPTFYEAAGSVTSAGNALQIAGASVARVGVGQYDITFNTPVDSADYPVLATMQGLPQNDDYQWAYLNQTVNSFRIEIREQDNGGSPGVLRDSGFSFFVPIIEV